MKQHQLWFVTFILFLMLAGGAEQIRAADAVVGDGSPGSCTEAALDTALAAAGGGGTVTFNCGVNPHTILLTSTKSLTDDLIIDGGDLIALSGGGAVRPFLITGSPVEVRRLTLTQGQAAFGGAIQVAAGGYLTLTNSYLSHNTATSVGGGLYNNGGTAVLSNVTLDNNVANYGGGIYNNGPLTLTDVTLVDNTVTSAGGGLYNNQGATLSNVTLATNIAADGGAILNSATATLAISNGTLSGNQANFGGGLFNNGVATLINATIFGNQTIGGGGGIIHDSGGVPQLTLINVILAQNTSPAAANDQCLFYKAPDSFIHSLWSGVSCGTAAIDGNQPNTNALLAPLGFTGTGLPTELTMTHALLPGSPAEDMGTCADGASPTDQRGVDRPQGAGCDVGAVETIPVPPVYGFVMSGAGTLAGLPGTAVSHTLTLTNTGNFTDTIDLAVGTAVWPTQLSQASITLGANESAAISVIVDIPANADGGETDNVTVNAVSQGDASQTAVAALTTRVYYRNFIPLVIQP
ncbi:MAG: hypothetical protein KA362_07045 [Chloroflexi bacterium]|nr:hypothetical protein [Chloroflexota bacterium]MBK7917904.1 hypothetical protein [Chloroflexota bacterium]MBK8935454.1 hypothetical protein [Chloroflexota bacterium]MBP6803848.1 hypothetical protein [Chloroflexota bacterium]MBP7590451.1 hypothetical protein [Chloroflexota bacterium]